MARVAARTRTDTSHPVDAGVDGLFRQLQVHHVGKNAAAIGLDDLHDRARGAEGRNDNGRLVVLDQFKLVKQSGSGGEGNQIRYPGAILCCHRIADLPHPLVQLVNSAGVRGRKRSTNATFAGGNDHFRTGDSKHGGTNNGQSHLQISRAVHGLPLLVLHTS